MSLSLPTCSTPLTNSGSIVTIDYATGRFSPEGQVLRILADGTDVFQHQLASCAVPLTDFEVPPQFLFHRFGLEGRQTHERGIRFGGHNEVAPDISGGVLSIRPGSDGNLAEIWKAFPENIDLLVQRLAAAVVEKAALAEKLLIVHQVEFVVHLRRNRREYLSGTASPDVFKPYRSVEIIGG